MIPRDLLIGYIKALDAQSTNESFITPSMAIKIIDYVHRLNHGTAVISEVSN